MNARDQDGPVPLEPGKASGRRKKKGTAGRPAAPSPAPDTASAAKPKRRRISEKRERANEALRLELHGLRATLAQILEGYEVRVGGRINDLLRTLEGDRSLDQAPRFLTAAQAQAALDEIAKVRLRPDKPRIRDLRRIQRLVRKLRDRIPE